MRAVHRVYRRQLELRHGGHAVRRGNRRLRRSDLGGGNESRDQQFSRHGGILIGRQHSGVDLLQRKPGGYLQRRKPGRDFHRRRRVVQRIAELP
jgi:hypothetical protein